MQTWTQPGRPQYATWKATYEQIRQRHIAQGSRPALSSGYKPHGPREEVESLIERAENGSQGAVELLGNWWRSGASRPFTTEERMVELGVDIRRTPYPHPMAPAVKW